MILCKCGYCYGLKLQLDFIEFYQAKLKSVFFFFLIMLVKLLYVELLVGTFIDNWM